MERLRQPAVVVFGRKDLSSAREWSTGIDDIRFARLCNRDCKKCGLSINFINLFFYVFITRPDFFLFVNDQGGCLHLLGWFGLIFCTVEIFVMIV